MSRWTHAVCDFCYGQICPGRQPSRLINPDSDTPEVDVCCKCGAATQGVYWRADPTTLPCLGESGTHLLGEDG